MFAAGPARVAALVFAAVAALAGCAPTVKVVLLPEPDGRKTAGSKYMVQPAPR